MTLLDQITRLLLLLWAVGFVCCISFSSLEEEYFDFESSEVIVLNTTRLQAKVVTDKNGTKHFENTNTIRVGRNLDEFFFDPAENEVIPVEDMEAFDRARRTSDTWSSSGCNVVSSDNLDDVYFQMRFKVLVCKDEVRPNKKIFRFYSRFPGTYVVRVVNSRGHHIIVVRTYDAHQVRVIPVHFHVNSDTKSFLMVKKQCSGGFVDSSFGFESLELNDVFSDCKRSSGSCSDSSDHSAKKGRFSLVYRGKDWAVLEPRKPFDKSSFLQIGACPIFSTTQSYDHTLVFGY